MINVDAVRKVYETKEKRGWFRSEKKQVEAVKKLSMELHQGEIVGLLGLNGAGKTTTIKMISTLLEPTEGSITVDGLDIISHRKQIQERINMIAGGERMLYMRLTGRENLHYFGRLYGLNDSEIKERVEYLLDEVGLNEAKDTPVERYSKGMKQRLQIARGLINQPDYLLLDEPTLGLDAPIARHLRQLIRKLAKEQGRGILLTSHYLQEVEELCDRVYVINKGELILCDSPAEVIRKTAGYQTIQIDVTGWEDRRKHQLCHLFHLSEEAVIADKNTDDLTRLQIKTPQAEQLVSKLLSWFIQQGLQVIHFTIQKPSLEDAIIMLSEGGVRNETVLENLSS
ncbi:ABC transporter ATP-binding protein [Brevibacillus sp. SYSU BS000544]|uniref:ABC transporter ATP-binding protein n=1 Tax=Brevibacillus sp. SYSU BS000544 TaxID=3416443 RepID=UPI003CE4FB88